MQGQRSVDRSTITADPWPHCQTATIHYYAQATGYSGNREAEQVQYTVPVTAWG